MAGTKQRLPTRIEGERKKPDKSGSDHNNPGPPSSSNPSPPAQKEEKLAANTDISASSFTELPKVIAEHQTSLGKILVNHDPFLENMRSVWQKSRGADASTTKEESSEEETPDTATTEDTSDEEYKEPSLRE